MTGGFPHKGSVKWKRVHVRTSQNSLLLWTFPQAHIVWARELHDSLFMYWNQIRSDCSSSMQLYHYISSFIYNFVLKLNQYWFCSSTLPLSLMKLFCLFFAPLLLFNLSKPTCAINTFAYVGTIKRILPLFLNWHLQLPEIRKTFFQSQLSTENDHCVFIVMYIAV